MFSLFELKGKRRFCLRGFMIVRRRKEGELRTREGKFVFN